MDILLMEFYYIQYVVLSVYLLNQKNLYHESEVGVQIFLKRQNKNLDTLLEIVLYRLQLIQTYLNIYSFLK